MSKKARPERSATNFGWIARRLHINAPTPGRRWQIALAVTAVMAVVAGLATWALWPDPPRQREYLDAKACLLTDEKGILSEPAKTVWSSMKDASVKTLVRVQYLQVTGEQTAENSESYLNTLAMSRCGLIVAAGRAPVEAVTRNAGGNPDIEFITVNGEIAAGNVLNLDASATEKLRKELQDRLEDLADVAS